MRKILNAMILSIFLLIISSCNSVYAGTGAIPSGENIKLLKDNLRFKSTDTKIMSNDADDPAVVGKDAEIGSLYIKKTTGELFQKMDSGSSTNWNTMLGGASGNGTDNHATRWDGTGTPTLQDSLVIIDDVGAVSGVTQLDVDNIQIDANSILSTDVNGNITLNPNGTGGVELPDLAVSLPLKLNATSTIVSGAIVLDSTDVINVLPIANGGTATSTPLSNDRIMVSSGGAIHEAPALTDGQLLIGGTGSGAAPNSITGTVNQVIVTNGPNSITLSTPQDINSTSTPTFSSLTLSGLTEDSILFAGPGGLVSEDNLNFYFDNPTDSFYLSGTSTVTGMSIVDNITLDGNTISSVGDLTIDPSGAIVLPDLLASKPLKLSATSSIISGDIDLTSEVTGILPIANGGTGTTTPAVIFDGDGTNVTALRDSFKFDNGSVFNATDDETVSFSHLQGEGSEIFNTSPYKMFGKKGFAKYGETTDFTTGRSATFDGGGAINGTFGKTQSSLLETSDTDNYIYIQFAGSLNDFFYLTIPVDEGKNIGFRFLYNYDGNDSDLEYEAKCTTSGDILTDNITTTLPAAASSTPVAGSLYIPAGCGDLKFGFSVAVENIGQIFRFNRLSFTDNPYVDKDLVNITDWQDYTPTNTQGFGTIASVNLQWRRVGDSMEIRGNFDTGAVAASEGQIELPNSEIINTGTSRTMVGIWSRDFSSNTHGGIVIGTNGDTYLNFSTNGVFGGDTVNAINPVNGNSVTGSTSDITIHATIPILGWTAKTSHVIAYSSQNAANLVVEGAGNGGTVLTANVTDIDFTEVTDEGFGGANWSGSVFTAPSNGNYHFTGMIRMTASSGNSFDIYKNGANYRMITGIVSTAYKPFSETIELLKNDTISIRSDTSVTLSNSTLEHHIAISKLGIGDLLGVPKPLIGYVTHEETSGTHGGTATSGNDATGFGRLRVLNNSYGDFSKFGTLSANIISLDAGVYGFEVEAYVVNGDDSAIKIYNDTTSLFTDIVSLNARAHSADNTTVPLIAKGMVSINSKSDFTLQHKIDTTVSTFGYGIAMAYGTETYVRIKITKHY